MPKNSSILAIIAEVGTENRDYVSATLKYSHNDLLLLWRNYRNMNVEPRKPRVLVATVGSWSSRNGSNTMSSLMKEYGADNVAALYIRADMSDSESASRYFHIIEGRVMKSILHPSMTTGEEFRPGDAVITDSSEELTAENARYSMFSKHRCGIFIFARELVWKLGHWKSKELDTFLDDYKPEVLICPIESYRHFNTLNEYIIKHCNPRIIGFLWDDNFTYKQHPHSLVFKIERFFLRKQVRRLINSCTDVLAISPKMKEECDKEFGVDSIVITKPIFNCGEFEDYQAGTPVRILYTGKLIIGRDDTVIEVVKAIKEINKDGQKAILDIYTNTQLSEDKKAKIAVESCCNLHDPVPQSEVAALQKNADVLLFAESLSDRDLTARLSFSTKLTDYFAAGKCIWAVGNSDLGPISYINSEDAGLVSTNIKEIRDTLEKMVSDKKLIIDYARKGYDCGRRNHNGDEVIERLHSIILGNY